MTQNHKDCAALAADSKKHLTDAQKQALKVKHAKRIIRDSIAALQEAGATKFNGSIESRLYPRAGYTKNVYPGSIKFLRGSQLEYDFIVSPGADPRVIELAFNGVNRLFIDKGDLVLRIKGSDEIRFQKPIVYQHVNKAKQQILARYVRKANHQVGFAIGSYDESKPLIIDPVFLYSTYMGGSRNDAGFDVAVDGSGNSYVTSSTDSPDVFVSRRQQRIVAKFNAADCEHHVDFFSREPDASGRGFESYRAAELWAAGLGQSRLRDHWRRRILRIPKNRNACGAAFRCPIESRFTQAVTEE